MDHNYVDIEAYVQRAQKLRSDALGEFFSAGLRRLKQLFSRLKQNGMSSNAGVAKPSACIDSYYWP